MAEEPDNLVLHLLGERRGRRVAKDDLAGSLSAFAERIPRSMDSKINSLRADLALICR